MPTYAAAAAGAVIVSSAVMLLVFWKLKLLNIRTLLSIAAASLVSIAAFPYLFGIIAGLRGGSSDPASLAVAMVLTVVLALLLAFLFSILISVLFVKPAKMAEQTADGPAEAEAAASGTGGENYLEQIYDKLVHENARETENREENREKAENNLEISVDTSENIDKMGIENIVQASTAVTIEDSIESAFQHKEAGEAEAAIQCLMDALDKKPQRDLTFWIVLDICVLYKNLGQAELAYDILNSYHEQFGGMMDASVKEEIEFNLFDIRA